MREAEAGTKVKLTGKVAFITNAFGMVPNGFYLIDEEASIYVYGSDVAGQVKVGNTVTIAAEKTYYVLDSEKENASKYGYKGCCQVQSPILLENDNQTSQLDLSWAQETTVKDIMETAITENITTSIYKVNALVKKVPGSGFTNYYINDIDGETGSYVYTACNGNDFTWLNDFDGKICTIYLSAINAKSTASGCFYRFIPILVQDNNYTFDLTNSADFAIKYYAYDQFKTEYTANPELELITEVSSDLLGIDKVSLSYSSSDETIIKFVESEGKVIMNTLESGKATITITASYESVITTKTLEITVSKPVEYDYINVKSAIDSTVETEVIVKGIVGASLVNRTGFYLIDETGVIAVLSDEDTVSDLKAGTEVIVKGIRTQFNSVEGEYIGQTCLNNSVVLVNNYGTHEYSKATFISGKTLQELYDTSYTEQHSNEVYIVTAKIQYVQSAYSSSYKVVSLDGATSLTLYCSSANQYSWLAEYTDKEVTLELAMCNWNKKKYYAYCIVSLTYEGTTIINTLNFNE